MKKVAKSIIQSIASAFAAGGPVCLLYHRVLPLDLFNGGRFFSGLEVTREHFEEQIAYLARSRVPVPIAEFVSGLKDGSLHPRAVCVTFDDGYLDNFETALPILEKYSVPATIFIAPQLTLRPALAWWYELEAILERLDTLEIEVQGTLHKWDLISQRSAAISELNEYCKVSTSSEIEALLVSLRERIKGSGMEWNVPAMVTPEQIAQLGRHSLVTLGGHTQSHVCLAVLNDADARKEVELGKKTLQDWGAGPVDYFAYPFGGKDQAGEREARIVASCGFKAAFTTLLGHAARPYGVAGKISVDQFYLLPRISIGGSDTFSDFIWKVEGGYRVWSQIRNVGNYLGRRRSMVDTSYSRSALGPRDFVPLR